MNRKKTFITIGLLVLFLSSIGISADLQNPEKQEGKFRPAIAVTTCDSLIRVILVAVDEHATNNAYDDYEIWINGESVKDLPELFVLGEYIFIGLGEDGFQVDGNPLNPGSYRITVKVQGQLVLDAIMQVY